MNTASENNDLNNRPSCVRVLYNKGKKLDSHSNSPSEFSNLGYFSPRSCLINYIFSIHPLKSSGVESLVECIHAD